MLRFLPRYFEFLVELGCQERPFQKDLENDYLKLIHITKNVTTKTNCKLKVLHNPRDLGTSCNDV